MPEDTRHESGPSIATGSRTAHYEILDELGHGGMGVVYRARDTKLDREVAIKTPWPNLYDNPKTVRRFLREGKAASRLSHPNIVHVLDAFEGDGVPFIVMEYVPGKSLGEEIVERGPLPLRETLRHAEELADALRAAHSANILHRDVKPGNVLIDDDGRARLTDFGLAYVLPPTENEGSEVSTVSESLTDPGARVGTLPYMSPEQVLGKPLSPASDLFSLGAVIYNMCTGKPAFAPSQDGDVLNAILNEEPPAIARFNYEVPDEMVRIVRKLLNKPQDLRYQTATDLLVDLRSLRRGIESGENPVETHADDAPKRAIGFSAALAAVIVAAVLGTWWMTRRGPDSEPLVMGTPRRLTTAPGWESEPALSPDGTMVAYTSNQSGNPDIWVIDARGGEPLRLTDDPAVDRDPSWYPDGSAIAFVSDRSGVQSVWKVPRLGGQTVLVAPDADYPAVSPDGERIAFSRASHGGNQRIAVAPLDAPTNATSLTGDDDGFWNHTHPAWSADGSEIGYADLKDVWIVGSTGGRPRRLTTDHATDRMPAWSADGRDVVFSSFREGTLALWRIPAAGGRATRLTLGTGPETDPSVSANGSRVAYSTLLESTDIVLLDRASGQERRFPTMAPEVAPVFAPDGNSIVYMAERQGRCDLWLQPLDGLDPRGPPRQITDHSAIANLPSFSPDGTHIAYLSVEDQQRDIWIAPLDGGLPRPLVQHPAADTYPSWSPDGTRVAFTSDRTGSLHVWIAPVRNGSPTGPPWPVAQGESNDWFANWSPDGTRLAFVSDRGGSADAWVIDVVDEGGIPRRVTRNIEVKQIRWDGPDAILVSGPTEDEGVGIQRVIVANGQAAPLNPPVEFGRPDAVGDFNVSPDGRFLAFVRQETRGDVWVMDMDPSED